MTAQQKEFNFLLERSAKRVFGFKTRDARRALALLAAM